MFGDRCYGEPQCNHQLNWTCPCTCGEGERQEVRKSIPFTPAQVSEVDLLKAKIEGMALYVRHDAGCRANDFDYLDKSPCTCGLRQFYNPKGNPDNDVTGPAGHYQAATTAPHKSDATASDILSREAPNGE